MEKKGNSFIIVILVLLIIIGLVGGYYLGKNNVLEKKQNEENINQSSYLPYYNMFEDKKMYDIYGLNDYDMSKLLIGYNNKMYLATSNDMVHAFRCVNKFVDSPNEFKFTNDSCACENEYDKYGSTLFELNKDSSNVSKVKFTNFPYSSDAQFSIFFINKDGKVDYYHYGEHAKLRLDVLSNYKVKDLKYTCIEAGEIGCGVPQLSLTLFDGSVVNVKDFDWF